MAPIVTRSRPQVSYAHGALFVIRNEHSFGNSSALDALPYLSTSSSEESLGPHLSRHPEPEHSLSRSTPPTTPRALSFITAIGVAHRPPTRSRRRTPRLCTPMRTQRTKPFTDGHRNVAVCRVAVLHSCLRVQLYGVLEEAAHLRIVPLLNTWT
jgi:hypothetical protein